MAEESHLDDTHMQVCMKDKEHNNEVEDSNSSSLNSEIKYSESNKRDDELKARNFQYNRSISMGYQNYQQRPSNFQKSQSVIEESENKQMSLDSNNNTSQTECKDYSPVKF